MACGYCPVNIKLFPKNNNTVNINLYSTKNCTCDSVGYNENQCEQDVHSLNNNVEPMDANNTDRKAEIRDAVNLNVSVNVAPANPYTIMPPPPHKMCTKDMMMYNYHRKANWKIQNGNGRSLSLLVMKVTKVLSLIVHKEILQKTMVTQCLSYFYLKFIIFWFK